MKKNHLYIFLISLSLVGYAWLGWNVVEESTTPTTCMFKTITHLPCPSCGTTRAMVLLVNGNMEASLLVNPFGVLLALAMVIVPLWILADMIRKNDSLFRFYVVAEGLLMNNKWVSVPATAAVLLNWFWNIAKGL